MVTVRRLVAIPAAVVLTLAVMATGAVASSANSNTSAQAAAHHVKASISAVCETAEGNTGDIIVNVRLKNKRPHRAATFLLSVTGHRLGFATSYRVGHGKIKLIQLVLSRKDYGGNRVILEVQKKNGTQLARTVVFFTNCRA
jgi:uncharacterized protein YcfJ